MDSKAKLILHPVRMKIVQSLIGDRKLNVQQISTRLNDVPQATLYRHLNKLLKAGIITVVQENQIRGTVEKIYALSDQQIGAKKDIENLSRDEHLNLFLTFMTHLLGQYESYLTQKEIDLYQDGVSYREATVFLSDKEFKEFTTEFAGLMKKIINNEPSSERKARHIVNIMIPEPKK